MARIRTIKPDFCSSKDVGAISRDARLFFLQLLTEADDNGRMLWIPRRLAGVLYPFDSNVGADDIEGWAGECEDRHMVLRYAAGGVKYLCVVNWAKHQKISHAKKSKYPPPPRDSSIDPETFAKDSGIPPEDFRPEVEVEGEGEGEGEQGKGEKTLSSPAANDESKKKASERKAERLREVTAEAIAAYNATLGKPHGKLSAVVLVNAVREKQVRGCIEVAQQICQGEYGNTTVTPEFWKTYFAVCAADPFNNGTGPYTGDHANWRPDFEHLVKPKTMTKIFERSLAESGE